MSWRTALSTNIKELRFILCQTSPSSQGVRDFITNNYTSLKTIHPQFPIIVRECANSEPNVMARYSIYIYIYI